MESVVQIHALVSRKNQTGLALPLGANVCVSELWCWWMKNRSTSDLSYTSPAPRAACAHRRQEFLIKSPTVTNHVAAVQHFCLFYDFTQAARER
jgi:hypothetical protein